MANLKNFIHKNTVAKRTFAKTFQKIGVSFEEYCSYIYRGYWDNNTTFATSNVFGVNIKRVGNYSFMQNVEEVLVDEVYKFVAKRPNPVILDCGANIGLSIIYFKRLYPDSKIIAFEPDYNIYNACDGNLKEFKFSNVKLINAAVWNEDGELNFLPDNSLGGMIINDFEVGLSLNKVKSVRLKNFLNEKIDFLKIDIEGAELEVMRDCQEKLCNVETLFVEYHSDVTKPQKLNELLEIITQSGFRYYIKHGWDYMKHPFVDFREVKSAHYDLQLNIFAYRK